MLTINTDGFQKSVAYRTGHWSDNDDDGWPLQPTLLPNVWVP